MKDVHQFGAAASHYGLENHGLRNLWAAWWNLPTPALYEAASAQSRGLDAHLGALVRPHRPTHRAFAQRSFHRARGDPREEKLWWGKINRPFESEAFRRLKERMLTYLEGRQVFVQDCLRRGRSGISPAGARRHRNRLAQPVRAQHVHPRVRSRRS